MTFFVSVDKADIHGIGGFPVIAENDRRRPGFFQEAAGELRGFKAERRNIRV
jgi:hypothetical protein